MFTHFAFPAHPPNRRPKIAKPWNRTTNRIINDKRDQQRQVLRPGVRPEAVKGSKKKVLTNPFAGFVFFFENFFLSRFLEDSLLFD